MCLLCLIFSGVLYFLLTIWPLPVYNDTTFEGRQIQVVGEVEQKECRNENYVIYLKNAYRSGSGEIPPIYKKKNGKEGIMIYCGDTIQSFEQLPKIGSIVCIQGKKKLFEQPTNYGQFDMARFYQIRGIDYMLMKGSIRAAGTHYDRYQEFLSGVRQRLRETYTRVLGEEDASVISAMLLGDKAGLDPELKELYQRAGLSHTLCISGLHISMLGIALYRLLRRLLFPVPSAAVAAVFIIGYGSMTGMGTATKRAVLMFLLCILADVLGRTCDLLSSLSFAAIVELIGEPLLLYDSGFLLSFGAVLGIGLAGPAVERLLPGKNKVARSLKTSLSIQLFTFPLTLVFFYQYPVYSIFLNLVMIPLMTYLLLAGISSGILGSISIPAGTMTGSLCHVILLIYKKGCSLCDHLPGSIVILGKPGGMQVACYYVILICWIFWSGKRQATWKWKIPAWGLPVVMTALMIYRPVSSFQMSMLDVGQGDCSLIRLRSGLTCLIDGGSTDVSKVGKYRILPCLKAEGIRSLDYIFVSHTDADHINGIAELLEAVGQGGIPVKALVMPAVREDSPEYDSLVKSAGEHQVKVCRFQKGDCLKKGDFTLSCLYPEGGIRPENKNAGSMVLAVQYQEIRGLFTGDLTGTGEEVVTNELGQEKYLFLKVAHHGSKESTSKEFLEKLRPRLSLISCGADNSYGHPHKELLERVENSGSMVYITKEHGEITLKNHGEEVKISCFQQQDGGSGRR